MTSLLKIENLSAKVRLVVEDKGKERIIEYFPHGPLEPVTRFVRKRAWVTFSGAH